MKCICDELFAAFTCTNFLSCVSLIQIVVIVVSILVVVGILTCILSHYKMGARSWSDQRNRQPVTRMQLRSPSTQDQHQQQYTDSISPATSIMFSPDNLQERHRLEAGAFRDHLVQLQSVQTDLILDLPHSVQLPDGEEHQHYNAKHLKIRDVEQQGEITRSFIRPPPNRTVHEVDSLPFRSNSVSHLQKPNSTSVADTAPLVMRSHSMSSSIRQQPKKCPNSLCKPSQLWIPCAKNPSASDNLAVTRTQTLKLIGDSKYSSTDPPPPAYSEVVAAAKTNECDKNTVSKQKSGI